MDFKVIRFRFREPVHISTARGDYGKGEAGIRSDTLYSAIIHMWSLLGKNQWIADFAEKPAACFAITSLFPFVKKNDNEFIYFFPKIVKDKTRNELPQELVKKFKKVAYYDQHFFAKRLEQPLDVTDDRHIHGQFMSESLNESFFPISEKHIVPRIMRPRDDMEDTRPFYVEKTLFKPHAGLFSLVQYFDAIWEKRVKTALDLLQTEGLGTDRSVGMGRFTAEEDKLSLNFPENASHAVSLSLFCPENQAQLSSMLDNKARYNFIKRGGWISEPYQSYRKRSVYMFTEGSLFLLNKPSVSILGKNADITPLQTPRKLEHPVYRVGLGFFIPCRNE